VLVSGPVPSNPNELIGSETMLETIRQLEDDYDLVIIDTPPVLPVADALHLSVNVDAVVVVTRLGETTRDRLRRTKEALVNVHAVIVGVVPNGAIQREDSAYSYAYRYRSRRKAPEVPYAPQEPEITPHPQNMRPAVRESTADQGQSDSLGQTSTENGAEATRRRGKHALSRRDRKAAENSNSATVNGEAPTDGADLRPSGLPADHAD
jgi:cellulose biosynthesis protein BcsQ